jgi:hypothetical protein
MASLANRRILEASAEVRDIGDIPPVRDSRRKAQARTDFRFFAEAYFPRIFHLPWSEDHLRVIARIEAAVLTGGLYAIAMPRGSGKTRLCEAAALWSILTGAHPFVYLVGSTQEHAAQMIHHLKSELSTNTGLLEDYPEAVYPIRCLEDQTRRCQGQIHHGQPTRIGWTSTEITMPRIPGSRASGATVHLAGMNGNIRGALHTMPSGASVRPSLVIIDDPQTDQSSRSPSQCAQRAAIINGAVLNLAGPGRRIAAIMPCTVISRGDLADTILNRDLHPEWQGERSKLVYSWPTATTLWEQYARLRADSLRAGHAGEQATEFYRANRAEMDAGAKVAWEARHRPDELSALQHAINLRLRDPNTFASEYQNEPIESDHEQDAPSPAVIAAAANGVPRRTVPTGAEMMTAFVDVQKELLYWTVVAWEPDFTGHVTDYGTIPDQGDRPYFTAADARRTLGRANPGAGLEGAILAGLNRAAETILGREWRREDGASLRVSLCLVDANWGQSTGTVRQFCRRHAMAANLMPAHGRYVGAASLPLCDRAKAKGERVGHYLRASVIQGQRHLLFDTNYWKSFVHARLAMTPGDRGAISLFGRTNDHQMFVDHLTAEYPVHTTGRGRTVDEWRAHPNRDNHWLDCLVGAAAAASLRGAATEPSLRQPTRPRRQENRVRYL